MNQTSLTKVKRDYRPEGNLFLLAVLVVVFFILDLFIGSYHISLNNILKALFAPGQVDSQLVTIVRQFRLPKALTALLAGAALSVAGLQMQT